MLVALQTLLESCEEKSDAAATPMGIAEDTARLQPHIGHISTDGTICVAGRGARRGGSARRRCRQTDVRPCGSRIIFKRRTTKRDSQAFGGIQGTRGKHQCPSRHIWKQDFVFHTASRALHSAAPLTGHSVSSRGSKKSPARLMKKLQERAEGYVGAEKFDANTDVTKV